MDKQILKAVEEAYRKGLREGNATKDIKPYLVTSQVVAHDVANKFCKALVIKSVCVCDNPKPMLRNLDETITCITCRKLIEQTVL